MQRGTGVVLTCSLGLGALGAACAAPPNPPGYTARNEACQVMVNVMYEQGANFWDLRHWEYIGWRESHCILDALADDRDDYSVCWFQINYKGSLRAGRTAAYGPPDLLREDAVACADAALGLYNANGFAPWGG